MKLHSKLHPPLIEFVVHASSRQNNVNSTLVFFNQCVSNCTAVCEQNDSESPYRFFCKDKDLSAVLITLAQPSDLNKYIHNG